MVLISLNRNPTCFGHSQPGIIYFHPWLQNSVDLLNWVPDRWFQCFQDSISNHFAHIAKLALKKGKELFCCINIPSELLAVKGMEKGRKSRDWHLKTMWLEFWIHIQKCLWHTDDSQITSQPAFDFDGKFPWHTKCNSKNTGIQLSWFTSHSDAEPNTRKGYGVGWFPVTYILLISITTECYMNTVPVKWCDCLLMKGLKHLHLFSRSHELITFSMPNLHFLLQLQLADFFI